MYNVCTIMYTHIRSQASEWDLICGPLTERERETQNKRRAERVRQEKRERERQTDKQRRRER